jgi:hypothetical protein
LFRAFFINSTGVVIQKMLANRRNPDQFLIRIKRPPPCLVILQYSSRWVGVLEYYQPATGTAFFTFHGIYPDPMNVIKNIFISDLRNPCNNFFWIEKLFIQKMMIIVL